MEDTQYSALMIFRVILDSYETEVEHCIEGSGEVVP
jgi:hypothetical protein